jgi:site-specific recombinase XerC
MYRVSCFYHRQNDRIRDGCAALKDFTLRYLRHTFASRLVMAGVDLRTVQELLDRKSIHMTMRYSHLSPEHCVKALEKLCIPSATATATEGNTGTARVAQAIQ